MSEELFRYSTESMTWTKLDTAAGETGTGPSARGGHSMTSVGIDIYLFGGFTDSGERILETGEEVGLGVWLEGGQPLKNMQNRRGKEVAR